MHRPRQMAEKPCRSGHFQVNIDATHASAHTCAALRFGYIGAHIATICS
jgi:hypothetical protein